MPKETKEGKTQFPCFLFNALFGIKGQLDRFRISLEDMATARKYCCLVWP